MSINSGLKLCIGNFIRGPRGEAILDTGFSIFWISVDPASSIEYPASALVSGRVYETNSVANHRARRRRVRWLVLLEAFAANFECSGKRASASRNHFSGTSAGL
jgi:hypothetical protein